jgi:hypothetical protein
LRWAADRGTVAVYPSLEDRMDRSKIEQALRWASGDEDADPERIGQCEHNDANLEAIAAVLQAALDEVDALPGPGPYDVIVAAREECRRRSWENVQRPLATHEGVFTGRCLESWERASEALSRAMIAEATFREDAEAAKIVDAAPVAS